MASMHPHARKLYTTLYIDHLVERTAFQGRAWRESTAPARRSCARCCSCCVALLVSCLILRWWAGWEVGAEAASTGPASHSTELFRYVICHIECTKYVISALVSWRQTCKHQKILIHLKWLVGHNGQTYNGVTSHIAFYNRTTRQCV